MSRGHRERCVDLDVHVFSTTVGFEVCLIFVKDFFLLIVDVDAHCCAGAACISSRRTA